MKMKLKNLWAFTSLAPLVLAGCVASNSLFPSFAQRSFRQAAREAVASVVQPGSLKATEWTRGDLENLKKVAFGDFLPQPAYTVSGQTSKTPDVRLLFRVYEGVRGFVYADYRDNYYQCSLSDLSKISSETTRCYGSDNNVPVHPAKDAVERVIQAFQQKP